MVKDYFGTLLEEIGKMMHVTLQPDKNNSCLIEFPNKIKIQMEVDSSRNLFIIGCNLGVVPPGRYRENIFREALKANGMPYPRYGDFSYSKRMDSLVLTRELSMQDIHSDKIVHELLNFLRKATQWQEALARGDVPSIVSGAYTSKGSGGMFGLT
jgi:hypothetical protein